MTEVEFLDKINVLKININKVIDEKAQIVLKEKPVDISIVGNDYIFPKQFICAALNIISDEFADQFDGKNFKKVVKQISYYL
jgi:hypothetical protein